MHLIAQIKIEDDLADPALGEGPHFIDCISTLVETVGPLSGLAGSSHQVIDYFALADSLKQGEHPHAPHPFQTFSIANTAFHLTRDPAIQCILVDDVSTQFDLSDLHPALADTSTDLAYWGMSHGSTWLSPAVGLYPSVDQPANASEAISSA